MDKKDVEITAGVRYSDPLILYFTGYEKCDPSHSFGPAIRTHYLIHYVVKGSGRFHENGRVHSLHAGDLFLILPGQITYYEADRETPWEYCWVCLLYTSYRAAMLDPHTAAELSLDEIVRMCDDLIEAHGSYMEMYH